MITTNSPIKLILTILMLLTPILGLARTHDIGAVCDATVFPAGPFFCTDISSSMVAADPGGAWTASCGSCIDLITGEFDPGIAGVGIHTVIYSMGTPCNISDSIEITVNNGNLVSITTSDTSLCLLQDSILLVTSPPGGTINGNGVNGLYFHPSVAGTGSHSIIYSVLHSPGCSSSDSLQLIVNNCTGFAATRDDKNLIIYPNPASKMVVISSSSQIGQIILYSSDGRIVHQEILEQKSAELDLRALLNGVYWLKSANSVLKVIIER
ncbi:MAG: hypothetical protein ACI9J3_000796 [Parvicellaceae bacterium]|jgi:hypothetical protein